MLLLGHACMHSDYIHHGELVLAQLNSLPLFPQPPLSISRSLPYLIKLYRSDSYYLAFILLLDLYFGLIT